MKHIDKQSINWNHLILKSSPEYLGTPLPEKSLCNEQNDVAFDDISRIITIRIESLTLAEILVARARCLGTNWHRNLQPSHCKAEECYGSNRRSRKPWQGVRFGTCNMHLDVLRENFDGATEVQATSRIHRERMSDEDAISCFYSSGITSPPNLAPDSMTHPEAVFVGPLGRMYFSRVETARADVGRLKELNDLISFTIRQRFDWTEIGYFVAVSHMPRAFEYREGYTV